MFTKQEQQLAWPRELRCATESTAPGVKRRGELGHCAIEHGHIGDGGSSLAGGAHALEATENRRGGLLHLRLLLTPDTRDFLKHLDEAGPAPS